METAANIFAPEIDAASLAELDRAQLESLQGERDTSFSDYLLRDLTFSGDWSSADWSGCLFERCDFSNAVCRGSVFSNVVFRSCDLSGADFSDSGFQRAEFADCRMTGAVFEHNRFRDVTFEAAIGRYAVFSRCEVNRLLFTGCRLDEASLDEIKGKGYAFADCDLVRADLRRTPLAGIDMRSNDFSGASLTGLELRGAVVNSLQALELSRLLEIDLRDD